MDPRPYPLMAYHSTQLFEPYKNIGKYAYLLLQDKGLLFTLKKPSIGGQEGPL